MFPTNVRRDVFDLYSFVRVADDYVDRQPQQPEAFYELRRLWLQAIKNLDYDTAKNPADSTNQRVVKNMVRLSRAHNFDPGWVDDFLDSMESDLSWKSTARKSGIAKDRSEATAGQFYKFTDPRKLLLYIHGSAEVIGLMLARIMDLPKQADQYAQSQGRALQIINFIRDLAEDNELHRCYFVSSDFHKFGLPDLTQATVQAHPKAFTSFMRDQIKQYRAYQHEANRGFQYIPRRYRIPIQIAVALYDWTAHQIERDPFVVFAKKVKPSKLRILKTILTKLFTTKTS